MSFFIHSSVRCAGGLWRNDGGWGAGDDDRTTVETYEDGWAWSLAISRNIRQVAVMVDGATTRTTRGPIARAYAAELAKTIHLRDVTAGATLERAWACDASLYSSSAFAGPQFLLVGDAASCIDPLSSFGVKKALASAWLGAITVHTALVDSRRRSLATDFFAARERGVYAADLARTRSYARGASAHHGHDFWRRRASGDGDDVAPTDDSARLLRRPSVRDAHERLRAAATVRLGWSPRIAFVKRPLVRGNEIVLEDAIPFDALAMRYADGVDLIALGDCAIRHRHVPDAFDGTAACTARSPCPNFSPRCRCSSPMTSSRLLTLLFTRSSPLTFLNASAPHNVRAMTCARGRTPWNVDARASHPHFCP